jgi:hypothetical protein
MIEGIQNFPAPERENNIRNARTHRKISTNMNTAVGIEKEPFVVNTKRSSIISM